MTTVLLSGDEGPGTLAAVRGLHAAGHRVLLAVARPLVPAARSRCVAAVIAVPDAQESVAEHVRALAAAAAAGGATLVLPGTEWSLRALTGREASFPDGVGVATAPAQALDLATDKLALCRLAAEAGLDAPATIELAGAEPPPGRPLPLPAVLKPLRSAAQDGARIRAGEVRLIGDQAQLRAALAGEAGRWLLQQLIEGELAAICGVAWRGELVCALHQRSPRIWPPRVGVSSYAITVAPDRERERRVASLIRAIGWSGVFGVQFLLCGSRAYVIDLNPRIYGSMGLALAAGLNLPAIWADLALGHRPQVGRHGVGGGYRVGVGYRVEEDDVRAIVHALRHERRRGMLVGLPPRRHTAHALFSLRDPMPLSTSLQKLVRRARRRGAS